MQQQIESSSQPKPRGCLFISAIVLVTILVTVAVTYFVLTRYVFPQRFEPVQLSQSEQQVLDTKLEKFEVAATTNKSRNPSPTVDDMTPEKYTEEGADRQIILSERELNGLLASNTDLAERLVIDLSDRLASGKLLIPLDPDFPIMGGKTLKITAGMELAYRDDKPVVVLRGVSVMGVPLPSAWLGNMKNVDLVQEFGASPGFWQAFADGVENVRVSEGQLVVQLRE